MKSVSVEEIQAMLIDELRSYLSQIKFIDSRLTYYNEVLGDTSFLLACLLGALLKLRNDWDSNKWVDDALLTEVKLSQYNLSIWGVMIWGIEDTTQQWTAPFCFEIELSENEEGFNEYTFLFCDGSKPAISYEEFNLQRNYWNSHERDWKYILNKK